MNNFLLFVQHISKFIASQSILIHWEFHSHHINKCQWYIEADNETTYRFQLGKCINITLLNWMLQKEQLGYMVGIFYCQVEYKCAGYHKSRLTYSWVKGDLRTAGCSVVLLNLYMKGGSISVHKLIWICWRPAHLSQSSLIYPEMMQYAIWLQSKLLTFGYGSSSRLPPSASQANKASHRDLLRPKAPVLQWRSIKRFSGNCVSGALWPHEEQSCKISPGIRHYVESYIQPEKHKFRRQVQILDSPFI